MQQTAPVGARGLISFAAAALLAACTGTIGEPSRSATDPSATEPPPATTTPPTTTPNPTPTPSPLTNGWPTFGPRVTAQLRRLTTEQYLASVRTLLEIDTTGAPDIEPVSPVAGFPAIGAASAAVSSNGVAQFEGAAIYLAETAVASAASRARVSPCTPASTTDDACFRSFVTSFGRRVFRRALSTEEIDAYAGLAATVAGTTRDPWRGVQSVVSAFLQAPSFLYLLEVGEPDPDQPGRLRFTNDEMASRLSFFLTGNTPDDTLLDAAAAGELTTLDGVNAQIDRLLATADARAAMRTFFGVMLSLDGLDHFTRPPQLYPAFTPTLGRAFKEETLLTLDDAVFGRALDYRRVFDQRETFVNAELAAFYGIPAPSGAGFSRAALPEGPRRGLLGQAGVLAVHDHDSSTSPTKRGLFVLTRLLCQPLALSPPAGVRIPPLPTGEMTARQRLAMHSTLPGCSGCHVAMDSVGLSLEHFDPMGAYRESDHGLPIDDRGQLGTSAYQGAAELGSLIASSAAVGPCLIGSLYGVGVGHLADDFDRDSFAAAVRAFDDNGGQVRAVLKAIAASDGFRFTTEPN
ncbi:MAG: DUF1592 domain-containing protein [Deltaproteobacteria bacterium]|nr:DUF1592 domain-containing protein [Deltaproteobacteria bacterium]